MQNLLLKLVSRNWCLPIILIFSFSIVLGLGEEIHVVIDTLADLESVGSKGECTAYDSLEDDICRYPDSSANSGYWTSCDLNNCQLSIRVGDIGGLGRVPSRMDVLSFVRGINAEIRPRYRFNSTSGVANFRETIREADGWTTTEIPIESSYELTPNSEIILRLVSSSVDETELDFVDKIAFIFTDPPTTTEEPSIPTEEPSRPTVEPSIPTEEASRPTEEASRPTEEASRPTEEASRPTLEPSIPTEPQSVPTEPPSTTTTKNPGLPDEVLDHGSTLPAGWSSNCEYRMNHEDYSPSLCPMKVPGEPDSRIGFWSSCGRYCALTYSPSAVQKPSPISVTVNSFVSGHATLDIWVRVGYGVLKLVGTINDTAWSNTTFALAQFGLDEDSEILFEPSSTRYPNHVDLIDTITIRFQ